MDPQLDGSQQFCLRWHNYQTSLLATLPQLLDGEDLTDVTLSAGGRHMKAHKVVLSACSHYFKQLFKEIDGYQHPVIILPGVEFNDLYALVTFMYNGEVNIYQQQLSSLLSMADALHIRGLADFTGQDPHDYSTSKHYSNQSSPSTQDTNFSPNSGPGPGNGKVKRQRLSHSTSSTIDYNKPLTGPIETTNWLDGTNEVQDLSRKSSSNASSSHSSDSVKNGTSIDCLQNVTTNWLDGTNEVQDLSRKSSSNASSSHSSDSVKNGTSIDCLQNVCKNLSATASTSTRPTGSPETSGTSVSDHCLTSPLSSSIPGSSKTKASGSGTTGGSSNHSKLFATCFVCGKQLSNQYNLRVHMETHQNAFYACSSCSHVSRSRDALRKHVSYRHPHISP
ncbi:LOW QUALITY PROTEIN: protein tramtrack, alpha isoform [Diaphorina citri]|uniref:LOW QUALITY PROTEIN: protein tramtrack, alpha isoform n=1 Tax=Diaphorina citri TaxID=121845 RepID=A0A3Q0IY01_DIACI|nr:LOW QUALITY PROTEIN: protein tramtrack, alpha isoform [Diaphorina citri]